MTVTLTQNWLLVLINGYFTLEPIIDDVFSFREDRCFVGSFIKEEIKNEKRS